jgi:hypothetical protein
MNTTCDRFREDLPLFVAGSLDRSGRDAIAAHLAVCRACGAAADQWRALREAVVAENTAALGPVPVPDVAPIPRAVVATSRPPARPHPLSTMRALWSRLQPVSMAWGLAGALMLIILVATSPRWLGTVRDVASRVFDPMRRAPIVQHEPGGSPTATGGGSPIDTLVVADRTALTSVPRAATVVARAPRTLGAGDTAVDGSAAGARTPGSVVRDGGFPAGPSETSLPAPQASGTPAPPTATGVPGADMPVSPRVQDPDPSHRDTPRPTAPIPTSTQPASATPELARTPTVTTTPIHAAGGIITGRALGRDGAGRAEVEIRAYPADRSDVPLPMATTDVSGVYALSVPPGEWLLGAEASAYQSQWYAGRSEPFIADPITVPPGAVITGIDLTIVPNPPALVTGRVTSGDGSPVGHALVVGVHLDDPADPDAPGERTAVAFTRDDGRYDLYLDPGVYALTVHRDWRARAEVWWDGKATLPMCDLLGVEAGRDIEGIDFVLW